MMTGSNLGDNTGSVLNDIQQTDKPERYLAIPAVLSRMMIWTRYQPSKWSIGCLTAALTSHQPSLAVPSAIHVQKQYRGRLGKQKQYRR